jgi:hypothetical protein
MNNGDLPANPISEEETDRVIDQVKIFTGLTKREHFAAMAMQGLCSAHDQSGTWSHDARNVALTAVMYADALLAELELTPK